MGLWVQKRDDTGRLLASVRFFNGQADVGCGLTLTIDQARQLARHSANVPLIRRDWALRVFGTEQELDNEVLQLTADAA